MKKELGHFLESLSKTFFSQGKVDVDFVDGGAVELKNVQGKKRIYLWSPASTKKISSTGPDRELLEPASATAARLAFIAVLPFSTIGADTEMENFANSITEDVITELSHSKELFVKDRNSSFYYKGKSVLTGIVGAELGANYVLQGRRSSKNNNPTG
ncbi:MAG: adenylate cyclase [Parasphingorhabdus sp.]|jgi:adenylate cyclase